MYRRIGVGNGILPFEGHFGSALLSVSGAMRGLVPRARALGLTLLRLFGRYAGLSPPCPNPRVDPCCDPSLGQGSHPSLGGWPPPIWGVARDPSLGHGPHPVWVGGRPQFGVCCLGSHAGLSPPCPSLGSHSFAAVRELCGA